MNKYLFTIIALAAFLRLFLLGSVPNSLYWEEAALGYDAYSIWKTGKDFHGNPWPLVAFESFGDYKPSGYFYVAAPFVGIFGLNNWSVRLPSALAGIATVGLIYLIALELFKEKKPALFAAFTLAILPWHIQFSRAAFEVNLATMWLVLGIWWLLRARHKLWFVWPAGAAFLLSMYTYHGLRVLAPFMVVFMGGFFLRKRLISFHIIAAICVYICLLAPIVANIKSPIVAQRFSETSLFSTSPAVQVTNGLRAADDNSSWSRLIHHRFLYWGKEILSGMMSHFSPQFLLLQGDGNQRHQTGYYALLYWWMLIPFAFVLKIKRTSWKPFIFIGGWILLATVPPAITNVSPHTLRFLPAAPAIALLSGYGLSLLFSSHQLWAKVGVWVLIIGELFVYGFDYFVTYPIRSSSDWQYGYQQVVQFIASKPYSQEPVQVTRMYGRPSMYFLYYLGYDPYKVQQETSTAPKDQGELLAFDRYTFGSIDFSKKGIIVNDSPLATGTLLKEIVLPTKKPVFYIYENN